MSRSNGRNNFIREYFDCHFSVSFREYANRRTVCVIRDGYLGETFKGVARCHKDDVFNEGIGRRMAYDRASEARVKFYTSLQNLYKNELAKYLNLDMKLDNRVDKMIEKNTKKYGN